MRPFKRLKFSTAIKKGLFFKKVLPQNNIFLTLVNSMFVNDVCINKLQDNVPLENNDILEL